MANTKTPSASKSAPEPAGAPPLSEKAAVASKTETPAPEEDKDDPAIEKAVDDITASEADAVLEAEDAELEKAFKPEGKKTFKDKISHAFNAWWNNKKLRYGTFAGLAVLVLVIMAIPPSRYFILNTAGVRASASVIVNDDSTQQPLKNVDVTVANVTVKTDSKGTAKLSHLKLGSTKLVIKRRAFATVNKTVVVGWGSNPMGSFSVKPTGSQYDFNVTNFLSGKPIEKAEASAGEADAIADDKGQLTLTIDPSQSSPLEVTIKAEGYRDEVISLNLDDKSAHEVKMVPSTKHAFVSKRTGKYDLYAIDLDGKNEKLLLAGSGNERSDLTMAPHPSGHVVALASSRDNTRNKDGYLLTTLNVINTDTGEVTEVTKSESIQMIDWVGDRLVFVQIAAGASANNPNRQRLVSYNYVTDTQKELASSNYFNDVVSGAGTIYYAPSDTNNAGVFKINPDGSSKKTILNKTAWNLFHTQYDHLTISVSNDWYDYKLGDSSATKLAGAPASQQNHPYQDDSNRKHSLWVDDRDGKGVLLEYDVEAKKDTVLRTQSGLSIPAYWFNDSTIIYRIHTPAETADYVLNLDGGQPRKISDVNNTTGIGNWYYY